MGSWSHGDAAVWDTVHIFFFILRFHMSYILLFTITLTYLYVYSLLLHTLNCVCIGLYSPFPFVYVTFIPQFFGGGYKYSNFM